MIDLSQIILSFLTSLIFLISLIFLFRKQIADYIASEFLLILHEHQKKEDLKE